MQNITANYRSIEVHSYRNMFKTPTIAVTIEYHPSIVDKIIRDGKPKVRKFLKSEGVAWHESVDTKYEIVQSVSTKLYLEEICSQCGYTVPRD